MPELPRSQDEVRETVDRSNEANRKAGAGRDGGPLADFDAEDVECRYTMGEEGSPLSHEEGSP